MAIMQQMSVIFIVYTCLQNFIYNFLNYLYAHYLIHFFDSFLNLRIFYIC